MTDLHITWVDIAVAAILILSTILAVARGFVRETLSIFAWAAAAFATLYFGHYVVPLLAPHVSEMLAQILAYAIVFFVVLIPLLFIGNRVSRRVSESAIGGLDRVLGALFGAVRGLVAIAVLYILFSMVVPVSAQAKWMTNARTLPLIQKSAGALLSLLPADDARYVERHTKVPPGTTTASREDPPAKFPVKAALHYAATGRHSAHKGYGAEDRRALNRLIETTWDGGNER
jgi:membrane protein required for colicin V production